MTVRLNPYLSFRDDAREAMDLLPIGVRRRAHRLDVRRVPRQRGSRPSRTRSCTPTLETPDGLVLMGADTPNSMEYRPQAGVSVSLSGDDEGRLRGCWERLSEGGTVVMPFEKAPWGDTFGMCVDRFGTSWMINATGT